HQLEAAPELCVARVLERGQGAGVVEELFAAQGAAAAGLAAFAQQGPGAEQVRLQGQLHEAGCFVGIGTLLQEQAHGPAIVRPGPGCAPGAAAAALQPASTARTSASATSDSTRARPAPSQTMKRRPPDWAFLSRRMWPSRASGSRPGGGSTGSPNR